MGTILYNHVLLGTIWYYWVRLGTIKYFLVLFGLWYFWVLLGPIVYFSVLMGTIRVLWKFVVCHQGCWKVRFLVEVANNSNNNLASALVALRAERK